MTRRRRGRGCALVIAVGLGLACEPIVGTPSPAAPINACPAHPCNAYTQQPGAAPTCSAGVCTVAAPTTNLLLVIGLAIDSPLSPGRTYLTTLNGGSASSASCAHPACCPLPDCRPPLCSLPEWVEENSSYVLDPAAAQEANWYLGVGLRAMPVHATFRLLIGGPPKDAFDLGLPVVPVLADNSTQNGTNGTANLMKGPNDTAPIQFHTYLPNLGCYERTLQPFSPFSRAFPPEVTQWPPDARDTVDFDQTILEALPIGHLPLPTFDIARAEGLEGWTAYLRDIQTKRVFSNVVPLTGSLDPGVRLLTNRGLRQPVDSLAGMEVVLSPPADQPLPTEALAPAGPPGAQEPLEPLLTYPSLPIPVTMSGRIRTPAGAPVPANVHFTAMDISQRSGQKFPPNFEFSTQVSTVRDPQTGASTYSVLLPQGDYQIVVRPTDGANAITVATRFVGGQGNEMTGEDFDVTPLVPVSGNAGVADGRELAEAIVEALPTQCAASVGDAAPAESSDACLPRPASTQTGDHGFFRLLVDPGGYLLRVRPRDGSRLPWKIQPITVGATPLVTGPVVIPAPISVGMRLTDSVHGSHAMDNNPMSNAIVRVFTDPLQGGPAVELGQAMTDIDGNYEMYIAPPDP